MLGRKGKSDIGQSGGDQAKFVGHRTHWPNVKRPILKLLPLAAFGFAATGQRDRTGQRVGGSHTCWLAVVGHASAKRSDYQFIGCRIADTSSDGATLFHESDGDAKFPDSADKLTGSVERIDDPDPILLQTSEIVRTLFGQPAFAITKQ